MIVCESDCWGNLMYDGEKMMYHKIAKVHFEPIYESKVKDNKCSNNNYIEISIKPYGISVKKPWDM